MRPPEEVKRSVPEGGRASQPHDMNNSPPSFCIVVPTYNNQLTIGDVIKDILKITSKLVVVDDGSTDGTHILLSEIPGLTVITHEQNLGKGAALLSGFSFVARSGNDYAITMDGDGQHLTADLPKFLKEIKKYPEALIIGQRNLTGWGRRLKSRVLRAHSNFWVWILTQQWVGDSQCGFRAYPLASILDLSLKKQKYDLEIEVLVKALWTGIPIQEVPIAVNYVACSRSHFRPFKDFMLVSALIFSLFMKKVILPRPLLRLKSLRVYQENIKNQRFHKMIMDTLAHECSGPWHFASSVGVGVFFGIAPLWGFQMLAALFAANKLGLSKTVSLISSNISFPAAIPFIVYGSLLLGRWALGGAIDYSLNLDRNILEVAVKTYASEYLVGSVLLATVAGGIAILLAYPVAHLFSLLRRAPTGSSKQ
jgi:glycosyltransferase involved in cell wall biosynthesis